MIVNIIIPTYKRFKSLERTVQSIRNSDYKETFTTIIIDGPDDKRYEQLRDERTDIRKNPKRIGWIGSMNETLKRIDGDLFFYGADDIVFYPDCISKLVKAMKEAFPPGDGLVSTRQHLILSGSKIKRKKCGGAFGLIGKKFIERFPDRAAFCPEYFHGSSDKEIRNYAIKAGVYHQCTDAIVLHDRTAKDETRKLRKEAQPQDHETRRMRWSKGLLWGETFKRVRK